MTRCCVGGARLAAPALAVLGFFIGSQGSEALANAESNMERARTFRSEMDKTVEQLSAIQDVTTLANSTFSKVSSLLRRAVHDVQNQIDTQGDDYQAYSQEGREAVLRSVKFAQLIKAMIDTPILDESGNMVLSTGKRIGDISAIAAS